MVGAKSFFWHKMQGHVCCCPDRLWFAPSLNSNSIPTRAERGICCLHVFATIGIRMKLPVESADMFCYVLLLIRQPLHFHHSLVSA